MTVNGAAALSVAQLHVASINRPTATGQLFATNLVAGGAPASVTSGQTGKGVIPANVLASTRSTLLYGGNDLFDGAGSNIVTRLGIGSTVSGGVNTTALENTGHSAI